MTWMIGIVGGRAVGLTAAFDLATACEDVTLFERSALASGSTGRVAGVLYDAYAEDRSGLNRALPGVLG